MFFFFRNLTATPSNLESSSITTNQIDYTNSDSIYDADFSRQSNLSEISIRVDLLSNRFKESQDYSTIIAQINLDSNTPISSILKLDSSALLEELLYNFRLLKSLNNEGFRLEEFYIYLKLIYVNEGTTISNEDSLMETLDFNHSFKNKFNLIRNKGEKFDRLCVNIQRVYENINAISFFSVSDQQTLFKARCLLICYMNQILSKNSVYWYFNDPFDEYSSKFYDIETKLSILEITDFNQVDFQYLSSFNTDSFLFSRFFNNSVEVHTHDELVLTLPDLNVFIDLLSSPDLLKEMNLKIVCNTDRYLEIFPFLISKFDSDIVLLLVHNAFLENVSNDISIDQLRALSQMINSTGNDQLIQKFYRLDYLYQLDGFSPEVIEFLNDVGNRYSLRFFIAYLQHTRPENQSNMMQRFRDNNFGINMSMMYGTDIEFVYVGQNGESLPKIGLITDDLVNNDIDYMNNLLRSKERFDLLNEYPTQYLLKIMAKQKSDIYTSSFNGVFEKFLNRPDFVEVLGEFFIHKRDLLSSFLFNCFNFGKLRILMDKIKDNPIMLCAICALATFRNLDSKVLAIALSYELATTLVSFGIIPNVLNYFEQINTIRVNENISVTEDSLNMLNSVINYFSSIDENSSSNNENERIVFGNQMNQVVCFYDDWNTDKDGHRSLKAFLRNFDINIQYDRNGLVSRLSGKGVRDLDQTNLNQGFLIVNQSNNRTGNSIKTYITLPRVINATIDPSEYEDLDSESIDALRYITGLRNLKGFLEENTVQINQLIHRGHSGHAAHTLQYFDVSQIQSILNCSCGGFAQTMSLLDQHPDIAHVFSTRGIGTMFINELIIRFGNQRYLESSDGSINYSELYRFVAGYVSRSPKFRDRFSDYSSVDYLTDISLRVLRYHKKNI
jgi:hypothetical protein